MAGLAKAPLLVFCPSAPEDATLCQQLHAHLRLLEREGILAFWYDRLIPAGTDWAEAIDVQLTSASIILLPVSPYFFVSDYCYGMEMQTALKRHKDHATSMIPILLRAVDWQVASFAHLQALPNNGVPVTLWRDQDEAFANIVAGIRRIIDEQSEVLVAPSTRSFPKLWNVPFAQNFFFTGRDDLLVTLEQAFHTGQSSVLSQSQAVSGLGGVGKTQLAVEYAYRYAQNYEAVFWVPAVSYETLLSGFVALASLLQLPEYKEADEDKCVAAVKRWLQRSDRWLLIFDNVDDLSLLNNFLPPNRPGHILLTTRTKVLGGLAHHVEVNPLDQTDGILLLLRRAGLLPPNVLLEQALPSDLSIAQQIWQELGGLPLAIDQAGAYIEETHCGLHDYLDLLQTQRAELLKERGGVLHDHPDSIYTTFTLAINAANQRNAAVEQMLSVCAFLHPDAIPEELFRRGANHLGPTLETACKTLLTWNKLLGIVCTYSLLKRHPEKQTLSIHRLVQAVLQERMSESERIEWTKCVIRALEALFPQTEPGIWYACERLVPHVLSCVAHTGSWEDMPLEFASLLCKTADYLSERAQYNQAEPLYHQALRIWERALGSVHPEMAYSLNGLANLFYEQGKYEQAEPLYQQALSIWEQTLGPTHPNVANSLNGLAILYREQGKYEQAKRLYELALDIREQALGPEHPLVATLLHNLAHLYASQKKHTEAKRLYERALRVREQALGAEHPLVAVTLHGLAMLYHQQDRCAEAEPLYERALHIQEHISGAEHPLVARLLNDLAELYIDQGRYTKAEPLSQRALHILEEALGTGHPQLAFSLQNLALIYKEQGKYAEAEPLFLQALHIREQALGPEHPRVTYSLNGLADLYQEQGKYLEAETLYKRALHIRERTPGYEHPDIVYPLCGLANLAYRQGKYEQAELLYQRALRVWERTGETDHSQTVYPLCGLANLAYRQGKYEQAELLYQRALHVSEQALGPDHPQVAEVLHDFAGFRNAQGNSKEARFLYQRALAIHERALGFEHPKTRKTRKSLRTMSRAKRKAHRTETNEEFHQK